MNKRLIRGIKMNFGLAVLLSISSMMMASVVDGVVTLKHQAKAGVFVEFIPKSPSAVYTSDLSDATGGYSLNVTNGLYNVRFSNTGYFSDSIISFFVSQDTTLDSTNLGKIPGPVVNAKDIYTSNVSGIWYKDTIYRLHVEVSVLEQDSLYIQPGTLILIADYKSLIVNHKVHLHGTEVLPIIFDSLSSKNRYRVIIQSTDSVRISNVHIYNSSGTGLSIKDRGL